MEKPSRKLNRKFLRSPLLQDRYAQGFGTLFTAEYDPKALTLGLTLKGARWDQAIHEFAEGQRTIDYAQENVSEATNNAESGDWGGLVWSQAASVDWNAVAQDYAHGCGKEISTYFLSETADVLEAA